MIVSAAPLKLPTRWRDYSVFLHNPYDSHNPDDSQTFPTAAMVLLGLTLNPSKKWDN